MGNGGAACCLNWTDGQRRRRQDGDGSVSRWRPLGQEGNKNSWEYRTINPSESDVEKLIWMLGSDDWGFDVLDNGFLTVGLGDWGQWSKHMWSQIIPSNTPKDSNCSEIFLSSLFIIFSIPLVCEHICNGSC